MFNLSNNKNHMQNIPTPSTRGGLNNPRRWFTTNKQFELVSSNNGLSANNKISTVYSEVHIRNFKFSENGELRYCHLLAKISLILIHEQEAPCKILNYSFIDSIAVKR